MLLLNTIYYSIVMYISRFLPANDDNIHTILSTLDDFDDYNGTDIN